MLLKTIFIIVLTVFYIEVGKVVEVTFNSHPATAFFGVCFGVALGYFACFETKVNELNRRVNYLRDVLKPENKFSASKEHK